LKQQQGFKKAFLALDKFLTFIEQNMAIFCFLIMTLVVLMGIVLRFVFKVPNLGGEELSRYMMVTGVFFGVSLAAREKAHMGINIVIERLPKKSSQVVRFIAELVSLFAYGLFAYLSCLFVMKINRFGQISPALNLPMAAIYSTLLIGFALSFIRQMMIIWNDFFAEEKLLIMNDDAPKQVN
jgi:C4-dicarboxylate transporter DctQ subunit